MNLESKEEKTNEFEVPTIQELYTLAKNIKTSPPIQMSEKELVKLNGKKHKNSIFANPEMMEKFKALPKEVQSQYKDYGENYYPRVLERIQGSIQETAKDLLCTVRSGISPKDLSENELQIVRTIYGNEWYKLAGLDEEDE